MVLARATVNRGVRGRASLQGSEAGQGSEIANPRAAKAEPLQVDEAGEGREIAVPRAAEVDLLQSSEPGKLRRQLCQPCKAIQVEFGRISSTSLLYAPPCRCELLGRSPALGARFLRLGVSGLRHGSPRCNAQTNRPRNSEPATLTAIALADDQLSKIERCVPPAPGARGGLSDRALRPLQGAGSLHFRARGPRCDIIAIGPRRRAKFEEHA
jgi:hypothetical protein